MDTDVGAGTEGPTSINTFSFRFPARSGTKKRAQRRKKATRTEVLGMARPEIGSGARFANDRSRFVPVAA